MEKDGCVQRYSHVFSPRLKQLFAYHHVPVPYILEVLDEFCQDESCKHHLFSVRFGFEKRGATHNRYAKIAQQSHGCACLLGILTDSATHEEIGDVYGVGKQTIAWVEKQGFKKFKRRGKINAYDELSHEGR